MLQGLANILEVTAKYAWAVFAVCLVVLFAPSRAADHMGLTPLKANYLGYFWLGFVFSAVLGGGSLASGARRWQKRKRVRSQHEAAVLKRIESLTPNEGAWLLLCLLDNCQTQTSTASNGIANSLVDKGILSRGSGSIIALPYHICDFVWEHLRDQRDNFLPMSARSDPELLRRLEAFRESLKDPLSR